MRGATQTDRTVKTDRKRKKKREKEKEKERILNFQPISTGIHMLFNANTHTRDLRTCVAVKPQKLFFLGGIIPLALAREGEAAAGANANAALDPLECNCVATENAHACYTHHSHRRTMNPKASRI